MRVIAFVGASGTGKSYKALFVAKQNETDYIIDDGLLIGHNKVLAGISAKKEPSKISAIRRACFFEKEHIADVKRALERYSPEAVMLIATSDEMAETIRKALDLEQISKTIYIQDVATQQEIDRALRNREYEGKHVIPVPTFELQKTFAGYFIDALKVFTKKGDMHFVAEKTIVRPAYSYLGKYVISDTVIKDIARHVLAKVKSISKVPNIEVSNCEGNVCITAYVVVNYIDLDKDLFPKLQNVVKEEIEKLTYMNVIEANIVIKSLKV